MVSTAHSAPMSAMSIDARTATRTSGRLRRRGIAAANPAAAPKTMPVSLMQTGIWEPFSTKLRASC